MCLTCALSAIDRALVIIATSRLSLNKHLLNLLGKLLLFYLLLTLYACYVFLVCYYLMKMKVVIITAKYINIVLKLAWFIVKPNFVNTLKGWSQWATMLCCLLSHLILPMFFFLERFIKSQNCIHQLQTDADFVCLFDRKFQPYPKRMGLPKFVERLESSQMAQRPVII